MKLFRKDEGFTLVELMVVVLIIGILVAIAIPVFNSAKQNAQTKTCFSNQRTIEGAANTLEAQDGNLTALATTSVSQLVPTYLKSEPECPLTGLVYTLAAAETSTVSPCEDAGGTTVHGYYGD